MNFVSHLLLFWIIIGVNVSNAQNTNQRGSSEPALTPLHIAAVKGDLEEIESLLEQEADIEAENRYTGETPIFYAVTNQHIDVVRYLIEAEANVDVQRNNGDTPLHVAARLYLGNCSLQLIEIIDILINEGQADTSIKDEDNEKGKTYDQVVLAGSAITYAEVTEGNNAEDVTEDSNVEITESNKCINASG